MDPIIVIVKPFFFFQEEIKEVFFTDLSAWDIYSSLQSKASFNIFFFFSILVY